MSRTYAHAPYWVRANRERDYIDHDHLSFGKEIVRYDVVRDADDNPVTEEVPLYARAKDVAFARKGIYINEYFHGIHYYNETRGRYIYLWRPDVTPGVNLFRRSDGLRYRADVLSYARYLVSQGRGYEPVQVGTKTRIKTERVVTGRYADYCTENENLTRWQKNQPGDVLPCEPHIRNYRYGCSCCSLDMVGKHENARTTLRAASRRIEKQWNSGEDIEDWDEEVPLTVDTRASWW